MNRGSQEVARSLPERQARFNEAPIHESGKWEGAAANPSRNFRLQ